MDEKISDERLEEIIQLKAKNAELKAENEQLVEALKGIESFAKEVVSRQNHENVFGYNNEKLTLTQLCKIVKVLSTIQKHAL